MFPSPWRKRKPRSADNGAFDPNDTKHVKYRRLGVWDLYEQRYPNFAHLPGARTLERRLEMLNDLPYVWRMLKDVIRIKSCLVYLMLYVVIEIIRALVPAVSLWYSSQFLHVVQSAIDNRSVDKKLLIRISIARMACDLVSHLLSYFKSRLEVPLNIKIKQYYSAHIFSSMARLDVPTFDDPIIQRRLDDAITPSGQDNSVVWETIRVLSQLGTTALRLVSELSVLVAVLKNQRDGPLLAVLQFTRTLYFGYIMQTHGVLANATVWAATTNDKDYIRVQGMKRVVHDAIHRKELVAGNLKEYMTAEFRRLCTQLQDGAAGFRELLRREDLNTRFSFSSWFALSFQELPQVVYVLRATQHPASIPVSVTSMRLIEDTTTTFMYILIRFLDEAGSITDRLHNIRVLYEIQHVPNKIVDGNVPFPENQQSLRTGISVEFRNVSFQYPHSGHHALKNVSFKIEKGQLCVLVGSNGSGKSTVLKLIMRLYDPTEGQILIDGQDIQTLRLADLRQTISVLFQDYTHFPLSIRENIGLGDPSHADDEDRIREAARLGGAESFIEQLPDGFDTYLDRPVEDHYSNIPEGTKTLFGRPVDFSGVRSAMGESGNTRETPLSGGQLQRLAVSRTFMRSVLSDEAKVGLLLFDEPSASLDPKAEHDLFTRLRNLRENKTMLFSSHRFGQLTRHADLIIYMNDSTILETGTHNDLIRHGGKYAELWNLQAQAFM